MTQGLTKHAVTLFESPHRLQTKYHPQAGASELALLNLQRAQVTVDQVSGDGKPDTVAPLLPVDTCATLQNRLVQLRRYARAIIFHGNDQWL